MKKILTVMFVLLLWAGMASAGNSDRSENFPDIYDEYLGLLQEYRLITELTAKEAEKVIIECQTSGEARDEIKPTPEKERNTAINIQNFQGILGDVKAENVQTGNHSFVDKHVETEKKKKSIIKILLEFIGAIIIAIIATAAVDVLGHFGLFERIYSFLGFK